MSKMNRREFLALAGVASAGLPFRENYSLESSQFSQKPGELFDPWLEINTKNFAWNVSQVRNRVENRPIMAVIKCNGYGHGLVGTAKALEKQGIRHFAVVKVPEAVELRNNKISGMILNFGSFSQTEAERIIQNDISQSVFSETVAILAATARKLNRQAKVHIKVDTGLGRVGVPHSQALAFIEKVVSIPEITIEGIFTTLTEEKEYDKVQIKRFLQVCNGAKKKGIAVGIRHAASSLPVANYPGSFLDMVRPGNCLYGLEPLPNLDPKPAMSLKTRVLYIKKMQPGETVSYHRRYKIDKETLLATLPLGYSDGYPHRTVNKGFVLIHGQRYPLVADMSANHVFVDITASKGVKIGDEVVMFGEQNGKEISIGEVAKWGDSSVYKVVIKMNPLLPRIFM